MSDYRRQFVPGGMFFLTVVTYARKPILTSDQGRNFLQKAIDKVRRKRPFQLFAEVLLPDHWHLIITLPADDSDYSTRMKRIKEEFTIDWLLAKLPEAPVTAAQANKGERGIWQPRFWEHTIIDDDDLERCVDYIHWNPRKHGLVSRVRDWPWSSFQRFVEQGEYELDWGGTAPDCVHADTDWGEP